ncbi:MAG: hypothetical protein U5L08_05590 [Xanthomonadales bacterium]|nr:hypothetical protein [Xanthomonadales bacterium]
MTEGNDHNRQKRRRVIRSALALGAVVMVIYLGFIIRGVLGAA